MINFVHLSGWIILHCDCIPQFLYPFLHWLAIWNSAPINMGVHIISILYLHSFKHISRSGIIRAYGSSVFGFLKNFHYCIHPELHWFAFHPTVCKGSFSSTSCQHSLFISLMTAILTIWGEGRWDLSAAWFAFPLQLRILDVSSGHLYFFCNLPHLFAYWLIVSFVLWC